MSERDVETHGAVAAVFSDAAWRQGLDDAVAETDKAVRDLVSKRGRMGSGQLQGFLAERWHADTLNVDAYKKGIKGLMAMVPESNELASPDIIVQRPNGEQLLAQVKYYKSGLETAKQLWNPSYSDMDSKIAPSDQLGDILDASRNQAQVDPRAHVQEAATHSVDHASDRLRVDGAESTPLGRNESEELTKRAVQGEDITSQLAHLTPEEMARRVATGAGVAAGIGFALNFAPKALSAFKEWKAGNPERASALLREGAASGARSGAWAGVQGAIGTALFEGARSGTLGPGVVDIGPGAAGAIAVVVVQGIRDGLAWNRGEISGEEFAKRSVTTSAVAAGSLGGAAIGQVLIPVPILGSLIGSVVGGLVARGGLAVLEWSFDKLEQAMGPIVDTLGEVLFGWDLLLAANQFAEETDAELRAANTTIAAIREARFQVFEELSLPPLNVDAIRGRTDEMERTLAGFERELEERDSRKT